MSYTRALLVELSSEPVSRAKERMADAFKRGGTTELIKATEKRIKATKDPAKRDGISQAIKDVIYDQTYNLTPAEEAQLRALGNKAHFG